MRSTGDAKIEDVMQEHFEIALDRQSAYQFTVDFQQEGLAPMVVDETAPLGKGAGPSPARLLAAAVGHCLSASALFCLAKSRVEVLDMHTTVRGTLTRDDHGRWRIGGLDVTLRPKVATEDQARLARCLTLFEDFCVVTQSVRQGVPVEVTVEPVA